MQVRPLYFVHRPIRTAYPRCMLRCVRQWRTVPGFPTGAAAWPPFVLAYSLLAAPGRRRVVAAASTWAPGRNRRTPSLSWRVPRPADGRAWHAGCFGTRSARPMFREAYPASLCRAA